MRAAAVLTRHRVVAAAGVAVLAGVVGILVTARGPDGAAIPQAAPRYVTVDTPPRLPAQPAAPVRRAVPHDFVARAVPTAFRLAGRGFTIDADVCAMPPVFPLDPPGDEHHTVCWVTKGFGFMPGSRSGTSYLLGHSWAQDSHEVLNKASTRGTRDMLRAKPRRYDGVRVFPAKSLLGARIMLRTSAGTLRYVVHNAFGVDKMQLGDIDRIMNQHVRNRIVLITCAERHGVDYPDNIVLEAMLASSRSAR